MAQTMQKLMFIIKWVPGHQLKFGRAAFKKTDSPNLNPTKIFMKNKLRTQPNENLINHIKSELT